VLKTLFPGYYSPTGEERKAAYQNGIVSLDANALLDLYRFTAKSREEFFRILELLKPRLFVAHQAALEFHRNIISVVEDRAGVVSAECGEIKKQLLAITERVRAFSNRHQIEQVERDRLIGMLESLADALTSSIEDAGAYDLNLEEVRKGADPVLLRLNSLLDGRVGVKLKAEELLDATKEAERRRKDQIPPGYADKKKDVDSHRDGDYLIWCQLLKEAKVHGRPVLLVSNENKEDWVRKSRANESLGPRPELVLEMLDRANVPFVLVSVVGLLKEAPVYLGANVSESTITEAESLPDRDNVLMSMSSTAKGQYDRMSGAEKKSFLNAVMRLRGQLESSDAAMKVDDLYERARSKEGNRYLLRWSKLGRAVFGVQDYFDDSGSQRYFDIIFFYVGFKRDASGEQDDAASLS
jgi:7,8-dihydro-6-hydroxymethylpterin-pyrophosphokinase